MLLGRSMKFNFYLLVLVKSGTRRKRSETLDVWEQRGQLSHRMDSASF